jgi:hypothetical protein
MNQTDQIIAVDDSLLELLCVESIDELTKQIILGDICFTSLTQESIQLVTSNNTLTYSTQTSSLSSMLGNLRLVHLISSIEEEEEVSTLTLPDDEIIFTPIPEEENNEEENEEETDAEVEVESPVADIDDLISIKDSISMDDEPLISPSETENFTLLDTTLTEESITIPEEKEIVDDALFDLTIPNAPEETIDEISLEDTETLTVESLSIEHDTPIVHDTTPIIIYVDEVSESIGISSNDYNTFLNEYIDTAISLESDLQSTNQATRSSAIETLTQLADVLELPAVNEIISQLDIVSPEKSKGIIESFYATLSRLTTQKKDVTTMETFAPKEPSIEKKHINLEVPKVAAKDNEEGFGTITLDGIKPIHFDFRLEEAANDLSLPVELIEEFVYDFIEQAHIETEKMLVAYEKGDLDAIQKIGHLLKGASSNLRINALSDTLYQIQFCEDSSKLEALIKRYWGQFLAFEQQIDIISN